MQLFKFRTILQNQERDYPAIPPNASREVRSSDDAASDVCMKEKTCLLNKPPLMIHVI